MKYKHNATQVTCHKVNSFFGSQHKIDLLKTRHALQKTQDVALRCQVRRLWLLQPAEEVLPGWRAD